MKSSLLMLSALFFLVSCSSARKEYAGKDIQYNSSGESKRPFWTMDGGYSIEDLRSHYNDSKSKPEHSYIVSQASVANSDLVPNCYNIARLRATAEVSERISETLKQAGAASLTDSSFEFSKMIESESKNMIVGAEVIDKTWFKVEGEEQNPFKCFIVLSIPQKNVEKLQANALKSIEKQFSTNPDAAKKVKESVESRIQENF